MIGRMAIRELWKDWQPPPMDEGVASWGEEMVRDELLISEIHLQHSVARWIWSPGLNAPGNSIVDSGTS
jgi:hypothetical protein